MTPIYLIVDTRTNLVLGMTNDSQTAVFVSSSVMASRVDVSTKNQINRFFMGSTSRVILMYSPETMELGLVPESEVDPTDIIRMDSTYNRISAVSIALGHLNLIGKTLNDLSETSKSALSEVSAYRHQNALRGVVSEIRSLGEP